MTKPTRPATPDPPEPTDRELEILKVLWERGESTVREVYEVLRSRRTVAQNTIQAFLRTMDDKGLVSHRLEGRSFVYRAVPPREGTNRRLLGDLLDRVFDGSMDQLVESAFSLREPTREELDRLKALLDRADDDASGPRKRSRRTR